MLRALVAVLLLSASPAFADQPSPAVTRAPLGTLRPAQVNPYKDLFQPQNSPLPAENVDRAKPRVVCGMKLIPADPRIDPRMPVARPPDGIDYRIRAIEPPICNSPR